MPMWGTSTVHMVNIRLEHPKLIVVLQGLIVWLRPATYPHVKRSSSHKHTSSSTLYTFATRDPGYKMEPGYSVLHLSESPAHPLCYMECIHI